MILRYQLRAAILCLLLLVVGMTLLMFDLHPAAFPTIWTGLAGLLAWAGLASLRVFLLLHRLFRAVA